MSTTLDLAVHLAVGYGYVALIVWPRNILRASGYFGEREPAFSTENGS